MVVSLSFSLAAIVLVNLFFFSQSFRTHRSFHRTLTCSRGIARGKSRFVRWSSQCSSESVSESVLNKLLNQAASLALASYNSSSSSSAATGEDGLHAVSLSCASHLTRTIAFNDTQRALAYLALPVSNYSVLSSDLVQRAPHCENLFHLRLPLRQVSLALEAISPQLGCGALAEYLLCTDITVDASPAEGEIRMRSGPFAFVRDANASATRQQHRETYAQEAEANSSLPAIINAHENSNSTVVDAQRLLKMVDADQFPQWLVWSDSESLRGVLGEREGEIVSSLQPGVTIKWNWNPSGFNQREFSLASSFKQWKKFFHRKMIGSRSSAVSHTEQRQEEDENEKDELRTKVHVSVRLDVNAPLNRRLGRALSVLPVRLLLQQAGGMIMSLFLKNLVPMFQDLLLKDYDKRDLPLTSVSTGGETRRS